MRRFRLLLIAAMLVIGGANASAARQNVSEIKGTVLDKATGAPLGWTTVALMRPDSTLAAGATCDDKGAYSLQAAPGEYIIKASLIGYKDSYKNVNVVTGLNEIEPLNMSEDTQSLVRAQRRDRNRCRRNVLRRDRPLPYEGERQRKPKLQDGQDKHIRLCLSGNL